MNISLAQTADILNKTNDEVMFLVQSKEIQAHVQQEPLAWVFDLNEIVKYKKTLDEQLAADEDEIEESSDDS